MNCTGRGVTLLLGNVGRTTVNGPQASWLLPYLLWMPKLVLLACRVTGRYEDVYF